MRHSLALLATAFLLAPSVKAQMKQHLFTAVVDAGSGLSGGSFGVVSPGDMIYLNLDVNPNSSGVNLPGGLDITTYWRAVTRARISIGGEVQNAPIVRSWVGTEDDIDQGPICNDALEVRVFPTSGYVQLGLDTFVGAASCPTVNEWLNFPTQFSLATPPLNTFVFNTLFLQVETPNGVETLTAEVTSETVIDILHGVEHCTGDGGDQLGCTDCPCMANALAGTLGGCPNSAGASARLEGSRSVSVSLPSSSSDLRFALQGAPPTTLCVLTSGDALAPLGMANPCFGQGSGTGAMQFDGLRCAVLNTRRHGGRFSNPSGEVGTSIAPWGGEGGPPVGIAQAGSGFAPGQTRYFQVIYRDLTSAGCGRGLNTSQAVEITFEP